MTQGRALWFFPLILVSVACAITPDGSVEQVSMGHTGIRPSPGALSIEAEPLTGRVEKNGITFETETSRLIPITLRNGTKIALLHDDKDDADKYARILLEHAIFGIKAVHPSIVVVERRSIDDILEEFKFQSRGLVRDQELARIGHFLGLDYVVVFDTNHGDLNEMYGLGNQIDTWEVLVPLKIIEVNTAEVVFSCISTTRAIVGRQMKATEVHMLNREAIAIASKFAGQCLMASIQGQVSMK